MVHGENELVFIFITLGTRQFSNDFRKILRCDNDNLMSSIECDVNSELVQFDEITNSSIASTASILLRHLSDTYSTCPAELKRNIHTIHILQRWLLFWR